jgi:predicted RNA-binding Zn ribbon-like protein
MSRSADPFEWSGGHPALDFVNTLDERSFDPPIENLGTYHDLVRFAGLAKLIEPSLAAALRKRAGPSCSRIVKRARELREHLHDVLAAMHARRSVPQDDLDAIAAAIRSAHAARVLVASPSPSLASHRWSRSDAADIPLHACALAIESLLVDVDRRRVRKCGASDCDVYFVDTSKGHRRRWCSMTNCGNREKQRRWRAPAR